MSLRQPVLFEGADPRPTFDGETFDPALDRDRLSKQLGRVYDYMRDHRWHTLAQIRAAAGGTEAAVSARLRDLRKERFGGYVIERRRVAEGGLFEYRLSGGGPV